VRPLNSSSSGDAAQLTVQFPGRTYNSSNVLVANIAYPFHRLFEIDRVPFFRPTWSPDGTRVVYSDGLQLRVWTVGSATSTAIAGTDDGIMPAWSPDGSLIAFSKPTRPPTITRTCEGRFNGTSPLGPPAATMARTIYTPVTRENSQLMVVKPDGTGLRALGLGDAPTWLSDSKTIVAHRSNNLYRINSDTGEGTLISNTLDAFEPAISRDGRFLSFARRIELGNGELFSTGNYDIWAVSF
jgi:hypothetical protein